MEIKKALTIAEGIVEALAPNCQKINIAGSCRRRKPEVKDIEIVCIPKPQVFKPLFGDDINKGRSTKFIETASLLGSVIKGSLSEGRYVQVSLKEEIKLDLFMPAPEDYFRQLAIRTGSADYSKEILAMGWRNRGWCGSDAGLRKTKDCVWKKNKQQWSFANISGEKPPVWQSEEEFFDWIGVKWVEPGMRNIQ